MTDPLHGNLEMGAYGLNPSLTWGRSQLADMIDLVVGGKCQTFTSSTFRSRDLQHLGQSQPMRFRSNNPDIAIYCGENSYLGSPELSGCNLECGSGCWQSGWQAPEQSQQALTGGDVEVFASAGDGGLDGIGANEGYLEKLYGYDRNESPSPQPPGTVHESSAPPPYRAGTIHLTPYSQPPRYTPAAGPQGARPPWASLDPRSSSTQSLVPSESGEPGRRTLLLVYIHGFLGNETSFQSFPAHVHNLLKVTMAETHVVHTKIYPRYRSRKAIEFARDDFSAWLSPHESETTDVVLLGHSMGGLLSAEVVLLPPHSPTEGRPFRHRILGTINFDTPFLGMHPGVIVSGIGSLFRPAPTPLPSQGGSEEFGWSSSYPGTSSQLSTGHPSGPSPAAPFESTSTLPTLVSTSSHSSAAESTGSQPSSGPSTDPNYNPPFPNDIPHPSRSGWDGALHFFLKYSGNLPTATKTYVMSHLEFGSCLADYSGLKSRYAKIRQLEDIDDISDLSRPAASRDTRRVRFVNYYTASTGRPKQSKQPGPRTPNGDIEANARDISNPEEREKGFTTTGAPISPRISVELHRDTNAIESAVEEAIEPTQDGILGPDADTDEDSLAPEDGLRISSQTPEIDSILPSMPPIPKEPPSFDPSQFTNKDALKLAEKEHARIVKAYKQAVKDHSKSIKDRMKLIEKRERKARLEREKKEKSQEKELARGEKESQVYCGGGAASRSMRWSTTPASVEANTKHPRDKKFCMLPSKIASRPDPTWIRVFMEGVDEVGAHCGLFFVGQAYEQLVGDVGSRIEDWVREEETRMMVRELESTESY
ncbi:MAG: hypothetical protein M1840_003520 [Geoglossum simile]|nr:MAG: hypothetical protein M1840_003520 [Geoglossum simile]